MGENFKRRYAIKTSTNAALALGAGALTVYFVNSAYGNIKLSITTTIGKDSVAEIHEIAKATGHEYSSEKCLKKAEVKTAATTKVPQYDKDAYIQCMKTENSVQSVGASILIILSLGFYALKAFRHSVSYGSLAYKFSKNDNHDMAFCLVDSTENIQPENPNYDSSNHRFKVTNGVASSAMLFLQPNETAQAGRGSMLAKNSDIKVEPEMGVFSSTKKKKNLFGRLASGEGFMSVTYTNTSDKPQTLMLNPPDGQQLTGINLDKGVSIFCDNGAFFASSAPVDISLKPIRNMAFQTFGGQGMSFQQIEGLEDHTSVLLASHGTITPYKLTEGESLDIQNGSLFALTGNITLRLKEINGGFNRIASGEAGFMTSVSGPGTVWIIARAAQHNSKRESPLLSLLKPDN